MQDQDQDQDCTRASKTKTKILLFHSKTEIKIYARPRPRPRLIMQDQDQYQDQDLTARLLQVLLLNKIKINELNTLFITFFFLVYIIYNSTPNLQISRNAIIESSISYIVIFSEMIIVYRIYG